MTKQLPPLQVKVEYYGVRFTADQKDQIQAYADKMTHFDFNQDKHVPYHLVTIHKLANSVVETFFYVEGRNNCSYDIYQRFKSKDELVGYCQGYVNGATQR